MCVTEYELSSCERSGAVCVQFRINATTLQDPSQVPVTCLPPADVGLMVVSRNILSYRPDYFITFAHVAQLFQLNPSAHVNTAMYWITSHVNS